MNRAMQIFSKAAELMNTAESDEISIEEIDEMLMDLKAELLECEREELDEAFDAFEENEMAILWYNEYVR